MKEIPLTQGLKALVDDEDYEELTRHRWHAHPNHGYLYAYRKLNGRRVPMHQFILQVPDGCRLYHLNRDCLDNRRANLAPRAGAHLPRRSYRGVSYDPISGTWKAQISVNRILLDLGLFPTPQDAARAYDQAALKYHEEFANYNFPREHPRTPGLTWY